MFTWTHPPLIINLYLSVFFTLTGSLWNCLSWKRTSSLRSSVATVSTSLSGTWKQYLEIHWFYMWAVPVNDMQSTSTVSTCDSKLSSARQIKEWLSRMDTYNCQNIWCRYISCDNIDHAHELAFFVIYKKKNIFHTNIILSSSTCRAHWSIHNFILLSANISACKQNT